MFIESHCHMLTEQVLEYLVGPFSIQFPLSVGFYQSNYVVLVVCHGFIASIVRGKFELDYLSPLMFWKW